MSADETGAEVAPPPLAFAVTGGGTPTHAQLAALVVALTPVASAPAVGGPQGPPRWRHAAIMEAIGHRPFWSAPDLAFGRRPLG